MFKRDQRKKAVAIVPAKNETDRIARVVAQLKELHLDEVLVVANGCSDDTADTARQVGATVIEFPEILGHDVARAVGAMRLDAEIYLFTDGDLICPAAELRPFVEAVASGVDVALNDLNSLLNYRDKVHVANVCKSFLNYAMSASELGINSLTAVPHCLSRKAIEIIGWENLMIPPKALLIAHQAGLNIQSPVSVDVIKRNKFKGDVHTKLGTMDSLIIGDHLEAIAWLLEDTDSRGGFTDNNRRRHLEEVIGWAQTP